MAADVVHRKPRCQLVDAVMELHAPREQFADDLRTAIKQLRRIPNHTSYLFADTVGGQIVDHRVPDGKCGPFNAESDFNSHLIHKYVGPDSKRLVAPVHSRRHQSIFTHSDLHPTNLLVESGRLSGIVDWECAAYKPEYWEFTKAMYGVWNDQPMEDMIRRAFGNEFEDELKAEQALWRATPLGI